MKNVKQKWFGDPAGQRRPKWVAEVIDTLASFPETETVCEHCQPGETCWEDPWVGIWELKDESFVVLLMGAGVNEVDDDEQGPGEKGNRYDLDEWGFTNFIVVDPDCNIFMPYPGTLLDHEGKQHYEDEFANQAWKRYKRDYAGIDENKLLKEGLRAARKKFKKRDKGNG